MDRFIPDMYLQSIFTIDYKKLKQRGIKCLCFDMDNCLCPYTENTPSQEVKELFHMLTTEFKVAIISNATKKRLTPFKEILNVDTAYFSLKPLKRKYKKILNLYEFKPEEVACIGDQLLTDIWGANRVGCVSILVNAMSPKEPFLTRCNRKIEKKIIKKLNKKGLLEKGVYYE